MPSTIAIRIHAAIGSFFMRIPFLSVV
jgi:hypothetical protein